jgi:CopG family transcriptional regulator, nickel-responsive regulator
MFQPSLLVVLIFWQSLIKKYVNVFKLINKYYVMGVVSVSLNDEILTQMDRLQKALGYTGRSEIVRAGIRSILSEERQRNDLTGMLHSVLLVIHDEKSDDEISTMRHSYDRLINTHLHSKIDGERCLEIFLLRGEAEEIREMTKYFQTNKKMDNVKLIPM